MWCRAYLKDVSEKQALQKIVAALTTAQGLSDLLESSFKAKFPKSYFSSHLRSSLGSTGLLIDLMICGSPDECPNKINLNDPMFHRITINGFDKAGNVVGPLTLSKAIGGTLSLTAAPGSGLAIDSKKLGFASKTGTAEEIAKHLDKYFEKAKLVLMKNLDSIYGTEEFRSYIKQQVRARLTDQRLKERAQTMPSKSSLKDGTQMGDPKGPPPETSQEMLSRVKDMIDAAKKAGLNINSIWQAVPDKAKVEFKHSNWTYRIAAKVSPDQD